VARKFHTFLPRGSLSALARRIGKLPKATDKEKGKRGKEKGRQ
jgi:hypothetical protein